jgi:hypothetical protein
MLTMIADAVGPRTAKQECFSEVGLLRGVSAFSEDAI